MHKHTEDHLFVALCASATSVFLVRPFPCIFLRYFPNTFSVFVFVFVTLLLLSHLLFSLALFSFSLCDFYRSSLLHPFVFISSKFPPFTLHNCLLPLFGISLTTDFYPPLFLRSTLPSTISLSLHLFFIPPIIPSYLPYFVFPSPSLSHPSLLFLLSRPPSFLFSLLSRPPSCPQHLVSSILEAEQVLVFSSGMLVECDSAASLLAQEDSLFGVLVRTHK